MTFLKDVGIRGVRRNTFTRWIPFRCPFHDDRRASAGMSKERTQWRCQACGLWGNATTFLAMYKGISTRQAHARIMARDYHNQVDEPEGYVRKTDRTSRSTDEIREQLTLATKLLRKDVAYGKIVLALQEMFWVSESTAKKRVSVAKRFLQGQDGFTAREKHALPLRLVDAGGVSTDLYELTPSQSREARAAIRADALRIPGPNSPVQRGLTKTENLTPSTSREVPLKWPGQPWQKPRGKLKPGKYLELADGRIVHESYGTTKKKQAEIDWLATGAMTAVGPPQAEIILRSFAEMSE